MSVILNPFTGQLEIAGSGSSGSGDVVGPSSSTDNAIARFDGTTGKLIQNSGVIISDANLLTAANIINSGLTASKPVFSDGSKQLTSTGTVPIANGGTNSTTSLNNNRVMQSSGGAVVEASAITAAKVLISDANGIPTASSVTTTTLGFLDATSSIQTQLNSKAPTLSRSEVWVLGGNGVGSDSGNAQRRFTTEQVNTGSSITYADSATVGATWTINTTGIYSISYSDACTAPNATFGISNNASDLTLSAGALAPPTLLSITSGATATNQVFVGWTGWLTAGDVIRVPRSLPSDSNQDMFRIVRIQ